MHAPVMLEQVVAHLAPVAGGRYIDGTAGRGGHTAALLECLGADGRVLAIDQDAEAVGRLRARFADWGDRCLVVRGNFGDLAELAAQHAFVPVDGILLDLGVSSEQLDTAERGFSFMRDGPLDMRMNQDSELTAAVLVNEWPEAKLLEILRAYGEEPRAGRVVRAIARARAGRRLDRTLELAEIVSQAVGGRRGAQHPATRTFQALRMAVNRELERLETGLEAGLRLLKPGGRMAVISFHSLEDRQVKTCFARHIGRWESLPQGGEAWQGVEPALMRVTRKPVVADDAEVARNPRSRSAKLRVVARCTGPGGVRAGGEASAWGRRHARGGGHSEAS
ncbi:MAG: 16S rRNA (cytosine(1402)-N(4))-methyltransferase RsmH [Lentisphaerae bacterium]|nr:16S rRNA (cytosine(1402)-N(4))-methyltransferase RsmH [Lentisphaerota bacterium]